MNFDKKMAGLLVGIGLLVGAFAAASYAVKAQKNSDQQTAAQVTEQSSETDSDFEGPVVANPGNISEDQAKTAALAGKTGVTAGQVKLLDDNGAQSYEVKLSDGSEVDVDAKTGKVIPDTADDAGDTGQDDALDD